MRILAVMLILALMLLTGSALAAGNPVADNARPHLRRIAASVGQMTGWDCQPIIADRKDLAVFAVYCEK